VLPRPVDGLQSNLFIRGSPLIRSLLNGDCAFKSIYVISFMHGFVQKTIDLPQYPYRNWHLHIKHYAIELNFSFGGILTKRLASSMIIGTLIC
jgi:hypothetical protein